ncbi:hypothetical protein SDC9_94748 [bioreactor metagenome]|uniref:Uncharacterized protein n=1 Tax=bioreactor metagenome TaxID=1076179 RepID=A0A645A4N0_9ZZZZ
MSNFRSRRHRGLYALRQLKANLQLLSLRQRPGKALRRHHRDCSAHAPGNRQRSHRLPDGHGPVSGILGEPIVIQRGVVRPVISILQRHRHQTLSVSPRTGYQRAARGFGVAGFQADTTIHIGEQLIVVGQRPPAHSDGAG